MYCKACRERMVADGTWTEAHAKRHSEFNAVQSKNFRARYARMPEEEKAARRARHRTHHARNRDARIAAHRKYIQNIKLDPVKWEARKQKQAESERKRTLKVKAEREKKRKRALTDGNDDDDGDDNDSDAPPAQAQSAIPGDNVVVISDDEDAGSGADISGSSVEVIEFVYSDEEQ